MTKTVEKASKTDTKLRGYYVGKLNGVTVCCCKGRRATQDNLNYLANMLPAHEVAMLIQRGAAR